MMTHRHFRGCVVQSMVRIVVSFCLVFSAGHAAAQAKQRSTEHLTVGFPWQPKLAHQADGPDGYRIFEFVREGDDIKNWQELVTMQNFSKSWGGRSPQDALDSLKAIREAQCPGQTKWSIIKSDEKSVLYEWQAGPCLGWPDQHEIAKIIDGQYNRFRLAYTAKVQQLPPDRRKQWIDIIAESAVTKN